ncbi:B12-binding domain-containing radical SAM protein [Thiofilum flexile]|uniref:B12-binding domain-containing radical SAM protein n=1 Tax=Thiofilum flexile TaxID=125627 RepID=UPI0003605899|nr:B12-binding domain-containing radical SAM protein [Thiofilum flexile]
MPTIILSTLNARYHHTAMGLRYLYANLKEHQACTQIVEFTINQRPIDLAEQILALQPRILGLSVYIWNVVETTELVTLLKVLDPNLIIVLGGPEVSYETEQQAITQLADYVITGAGEISFYQLCTQLLQRQRPLTKIISGTQAPLNQLSLPYDYYTDEDIQQRFVYVEASRGCPFKCEFCLSALDKTAYPFELERFLQAMEILWQRGLRHFKFVDRTFNLKIPTTIAILDFFLSRIDSKTFLHFELIPDHLPEILKEKIQQFPDGTLQFEIGIQTFNPAVQALISRKQDNEKSKANIQWLRENTSAHLHTDLIFGLPSEDLASFGLGFNQLIALNPHEIQVGILKRLRGTPIIRHTDSFKMIYNPQPPYNILQTDCIDFQTMQQVNRFARYWDMIGNSGRFEATLPLLLGNQPFERFWQLTDWLYQASNQTHQIALPRLFSLIHQAGQEVLGINVELLEMALLQDYAKTGQKGQIPFKPELTQRQNTAQQSIAKTSYNTRQQRHQMTE